MAERTLNVEIPASDVLHMHIVKSPAARDVLAERKRQIEREGWTPKHDDGHDKGELALAAACYAAHTATWSFIGSGLDSRGGLFPVYQNAQEFVGRMWPWAREWWKPKDDRSNLVRAAALLLAEIERLDRAADPSGVAPSDAQSKAPSHADAESPARGGRQG